MLRIKVGKFALVWRGSEKSRQGRWVVFGLLLTTLAYAAVPHTFKDGDTLTASQLNENFQALSAKIDAMEGKSWRLIYETDVTSATTNLNIAGLNGDTDLEYMLITRIRGGNGAGDFKIQLNGDSANNYGFQRNQGSNGGFDSSRDTNQNGMYLCGVSSTSHVVISHAVLYAKSGYERLLINSFGGSATGTTVNGTGHYASAWNNTGSNITSMTINSSTVNGIGAGSHFEVWARR